MIINIPAIQAWWDATLIKIFRQIPYPNEVRRTADQGVLVSEPEPSVNGGEGDLRQTTRDRNADGDEGSHGRDNRSAGRRPGWRIWEYIW